ncbi:MAG TPA: methionyl-tRNA formyltransferase [Campylobacterales bacterium]|nr:methionyl-tRNA formyltransferase [Campylobacterales bacterium]HHC11472.1 methionyl-tRNA formyltransferase [Campylobacterales bacterium]
MGTPHYAKEILETLINNSDIEIPLVLTQPDRAVGRKKELKAPEVKLLALEYNLNILQPQKLTEDGIYEAILESKPDFIIVAAFGQLLPKNILDIAPCINLHASLLPQYRGASPVQQSLLNGDKFTGVTAMLMEEGLDSGDILGYRYFKIPQTMTLPKLMQRLSVDACILTTKILEKFDTINPLPQTRAVATHCKKIKKSDGEVSFDSAIELYNKYRAFLGWPGIFASNGTKILGVELLNSTTIGKAGEILEIEDSSIVITCNIGTIRINQLQPISKKAMDAKSYCVGRGLKVGNYLF